jgi:hypothetical protein
MKVAANPAHAHLDDLRPMNSARANAKAKASSAASAPAPAPAESTVTLSAKKVPPGLQRVAARLESLGLEGRTQGQSNALSQISRNLQRYVDTQALAPAPTTPTALPTPVTDTAAPAPTDAATVPVEPVVGESVEAEPAIKTSAAQAELLPA